MNPGCAIWSGIMVGVAELIGFCAGLDEDMLGATAPGTYGSVIATLGHMVDAELWYLARLTDFWSAQPWPDGEIAGLDVLAGAGGDPGGRAGAVFGRRLGRRAGGRGDK